MRNILKYIPIKDHGDKSERKCFFSPKDKHNIDISHACVSISTPPMSVQRRRKIGTFGKEEEKEIFRKKLEELIRQENMADYGWVK